MSDVIATPKSAPKAAKVETKPAVVQALRAVQVRKFAPSSLQSIGQDYDTLTATAPADWDYEEALNPLAWSNVCHLVARDALNTRRDKIGSMIELRSADHRYFAILYIKGIALDHLGQANGLNVVCVGPGRDDDGKCCPIDLRTGLAWNG